MVVVLRVFIRGNLSIDTALEVEQDPVVDQQQQVRRLVSVNVFDEHLARPEVGVSARIGFLLEDAEAQGLLERLPCFLPLACGTGEEEKIVTRRCRDDHIRQPIGIEVPDRQVLGTAEFLVFNGVAEFFDEIRLGCF